MARHGGRQGVEGDLEFGVGQLAVDGLGAFHGPAVLGQEAQQRAPGKETHVGFVEQAFGAVAELARHQFGHEAAVAGVGDRQQQAAAGRQQRAALGQHARRLADVLQHVGTDDGVVAGGRKQLRQVGGVEVGHFDPAVGGGGQGGFVGADGQAVEGGAARAVACRQKAPDGAAAAAQVQHPRAGPDVAGEDGQGGALAAVDLAVVDVQRGGGIDHEIGKKRGPREARATRGPAGRRMLPCGTFFTVSGRLTLPATRFRPSA